MKAKQKETAIRMTPEKIDEFLENLQERGRGRSSLQGYQMALMGLYERLPKDKLLQEETGREWKAAMESQGFSPCTINARISIWNSFVKYLGYREWQVVDFYRDRDSLQPELTRTEYLRLLQTARRMEKKKSYLLIKTLGGAGLRIQELPQLTVESVTRGKVSLESHNAKQKRLLRLPPVLQEELMSYIRCEGLKSGPVFVTQNGGPLSRTSVYHYVNCISHDALVPEEKANPRCLWKMYQNTFEGIRSNVDVLITQAYERMVEEEQMSVGWDV